jgi:hypothetical protein
MTFFGVRRTCLFSAMVLSISLAIAACGGGGGGGTSFQALPSGGQPSPTHSANPSPPPTPAPSPSPTEIAACSSLRFAHAKPSIFGRRLGRAAIPIRVGAGPAQRVCDDMTFGHMRCMSWIRTDVRRSLLAGPAAYAPADLQSAYNLSAASSTNGSGQIVAIVDAYDDPNAEADLAIYRSTFALPACTTTDGCFLKVNESGRVSPVPGTDPTGGWEGEESLDLDMVSAVCPNCKILLVEADGSILGALETAEDTAASCGASIIANSFGGNEHSSEVLEETHFNHSGVVITASAGDNGYAGASSGYPATSQFVTSVGGTTLLNVSGTWTEAAWSGTGSLCSRYIAQPSWQTALGTTYTSVCSHRIANDVSAIADPSTPVAVYDSFGGTKGCTAWCAFGGTSVASPIIAAIYALAGNGASLTGGSYSYSHLGGLTDVTSGSNGLCGSTYLCTAGSGYDGPTGNGTPKGISAF